MSAFYEAKFKELFIEFTRYLTEHPEVAADIPQDAQVVLLDQHDPDYSRHAVQVARRAQKTDAVSDRAVIYIEVREMAPIQSRLREVEILTSPPEYTAV